MTYRISIGLRDDADSETLLNFAENFCETWSIANRMLILESSYQEMIPVFLENFVKYNFAVSRLRWLNVNCEGN